MDRRRFLACGLVGVATAVTLPFSASAASGTRKAFELDASLVDRLRSSPFVYISPIRSDGRESRCHAELWYAWMRDSLLVTVAADGWKARSVGLGLDRAKLWVGDYGRWKGFFSNNEKFRAGPSFLARAEIVSDIAVLDRLLGVYERKYPEEIGDWRDRMRAGSRDGTRVVLRYTPADPGGAKGALGS